MPPSNRRWPKRRSTGTSASPASTEENFTICKYRPSARLEAAGRAAERITKKRNERRCNPKYMQMQLVQGGSDFGTFYQYG